MQICPMSCTVFPSAETTLRQKRESFLFLSAFRKQAYRKKHDSGKQRAAEGKGERSDKFRPCSLRNECGSPYKRGHRKDQTALYVVFLHEDPPSGCNNRTVYHIPRGISIVFIKKSLCRQSEEPRSGLSEVTSSATVSGFAAVSGRRTSPEQKPRCAIAAFTGIGLLSANRAVMRGRSS